MGININRGQFGGTVTLRLPLGYTILAIIDIIYINFDASICTVYTSDTSYICNGKDLRKWLKDHPFDELIQINKNKYLNGYHLEYWKKGNLLHLTHYALSLTKADGENLLKCFKNVSFPILKVNTESRIMFINKALLLVLESVEEGKTKLTYVSEIGGERLEYLFVKEKVSAILKHLVHYDFRKIEAHCWVNRYWLSGIVNKLNSASQNIQLLKTSLLLTHKLSRTYVKSIKEPFRCKQQCNNYIFKQLHCHNCNECLCLNNVDK